MPLAVARDTSSRMMMKKLIEGKVEERSSRGLIVSFLFFFPQRLIHELDKNERKIYIIHIHLPPFRDDKNIFSQCTRV